MVLKVAHKVIFGFAIILLLLFFSSVNSINVLSDIKLATTQVNDFALPIQKHVNTVQKQLFKQARMSSSIVKLPTTTAVKALEQEFNKQGSVSAERIKLINGMLDIFPEINNLTHFSSTYKKYTESVNEMLAYRINELDKNEILIGKQQETYDVLDEASAILGDLSFLEDVNKQRQIDSIIGTASRMEGSLINLTEAIEEVISLSTIEEVAESKQSFDLGIDNVQQYVGFLIKLGEDYNTDGLIEQFVEEFERSIDMFRGDNNLFDLKILQLEEQYALNEAFKTSERHLNASINAIDSFLQEVDSNVAQLQASIFDNVEQGSLETLIIFIVIFVAGIGIAGTTIKAMIGPLKGINKVLSQMAKGDLSRQLKVTTGDEFGELSTNVNLVVADLRKLIGNITENTQLLNQAAEQSSKKIAQVTGSLSSQKQTIEHVTIQTEELGQSADHILAKADSAEQKMTDALTQSSELENTANVTNERMHNLVSMLDDTTGVMTVLQQESENISGILDTIRSISDQTNLLALNAAIEAARAGEAGRGFAVVADEVRSLASRTQASATEIQTMIESLQNQTEKAVLDIKQGKNEANNCQDHTNHLLETLLLITQAIEQMHQMSTDISMSAIQQNSLSNNIKQNIQEVVDLTQQSSDKSTSTLTYSNQVADLAAKLDDSTGAFKMS
ncbi:MAG: methyl-accepting chemotaxis protein [Colwellia sp.]